MASIEELRAQAEAARARKAASMLTDEEAERVKLLAEIAEAEDEARVAEKARRELDGKAREAEARKAAAGKYLVKFFDLGSLLPDADMTKLPGNGVLVLRSPPVSPVDVMAQFYRELEAKQRSHMEIYTDLVCESVVFPSNQGADGARLRAFFEGDLGHGTAVAVGDAATDLGGLRVKATKRGRG